MPLPRGMQGNHNKAGAHASALPTWCAVRADKGGQGTGPCFQARRQDLDDQVKPRNMPKDMAAHVQHHESLHIRFSPCMGEDHCGVWAWLLLKHTCCSGMESRWECDLSAAPCMSAKGAYMRPRLCMTVCALYGR